jgi:hypothetical protein
MTITQKIYGISKDCFWCRINDNVGDTAEAKIGDFKVEYLREFQAKCKKDFTHVRSKIL